MNKKDINYWLNEYWPELQKADFDSEEKQEKYVFTISTGAVGLLLGTLSFQIKPKGISLAIVALGLFSLSMLSCIIYNDYPHSPPAPYLRWVNVGLYEIEASINLSNSLSPKYIRLNL